MGGVQTAPLVLVVDASVVVGDWRSAGHVILLCSAPEWSLSGDNVMKALEGLCEMYQLQVKFGYDWVARARRSSQIETQSGGCRSAAAASRALAESTSHPS